MLLFVLSLFYYLYSQSVNTSSKNSARNVREEENLDVPIMKAVSGKRNVLKFFFRYAFNGI